MRRTGRRGSRRPRPSLWQRSVVPWLHTGRTGNLITPLIGFSASRYDSTHPLKVQSQQQGEQVYWMSFLSGAFLVVFGKGNESVSWGRLMYWKCRECGVRLREAKWETRTRFINFGSQRKEGRKQLWETHKEPKQTKISVELLCFRSHLDRRFSEVQKTESGS